jgi:putative AdoMet-dependent methyltransferase
MGREFVDLFDEWSKIYDDTVDGHDVEYKEVFENYEEILNKVSNLVKGNIIEFGVGTGNLTKKLIENGNHVLGVEPSSKMREIAARKLKNIKIVDGDFLHFPEAYMEKIDAFVSSYAFHHLTDEEKNLAFQKYATILPKDGKIVFADTMFKNEDAMNQRVQWAKEKNYLNLLEDLQREYYTTIPILKNLLENNGFKVEFFNMNEYVWIMNATKL